MNELERALVADSAAAPPSRILEGLTDDAAHRSVPGAPHTIYSELWHLAYWQQITLDWVHGIETPVPAHASAGFPEEINTIHESFDQLRTRFLDGAKRAAEIARDLPSLDRIIRCPSQPGHSVRTMSAREQLESLVAHNAYHLGRIVLLRQMMNAWPPNSGGFTW